MNKIGGSRRKDYRKFVHNSHVIFIDVVYFLFCWNRKENNNRKHYQNLFLFCSVLIISLIELCSQKRTRTHAIRRITDFWWFKTFIQKRNNNNNNKQSRARKKATLFEKPDRQLHTRRQSIILVYLFLTCFHFAAVAAIIFKCVCVCIC